uniref:FAD-binding protein n=1 Tax=Fodinicola feengrottensis TaxID=435914 RepID=UPI0013CFB2E7
MWAPGNHHTADNPEDALTYVLGRTQGRSPAMAAAFVRAAPLMVRFLERHTPIRFTPMDAPDSFAEAPGGRGRAGAIWRSSRSVWVISATRTTCSGRRRSSSPYSPTRRSWSSA